MVRGRRQIASQQQDDSMDIDHVDGPARGTLVRLKSIDGRRFTLTEQEACASGALRRMIESSRGNISNGQTDYIQLTNVGGETLSNVLDWCREHRCNSHPHDGGLSDSQSVLQTGNQSHESSTASTDQGQELTDWDKEFLDSLSEEPLLRLLHAANYLDIRSLLDGCCTTMARRWEGRRVEEIRRMYNIVNDFPPDVESQLIQENRKLGLSD